MVVDIVAEEVQIVVVVVEVHNLMDEIPYQTEVGVVPLLEHSLVEKALMVVGFEVGAVVVVVDRQQDQEKQSMVNV